MTRTPAADGRRDHDADHRLWTIGRLRTLRSRAGITQDQVATRLGLSHSAISSWEQDGRNPDIIRVLRYARTIGHPATVHLDGIPPISTIDHDAHTAILAAMATSADGDRADDATAALIGAHLAAAALAIPQKTRGMTANRICQIRRTDNPRMATMQAAAREIGGQLRVTFADDPLPPWREQSGGDVDPIMAALIAERHRRGLTQAQVADKVGIAQTALSRYELGTRPLGLAMAHRIAAALDARIGLASS